MKSILSILTLVLAFNVNAQTWSLDKSHTNIKFTATHLLITEVDGRFNDFDVKMTASKEDFTDAQVEATFNIASINTDNEKRDGHLKGDDFFNAEKFPAMTFKSTKMEKVGDNDYKMTGMLTIRDVTKEVVMDVKFMGMVKDPRGNQKVGFKANTSINRFDYNLKWNAAVEAGGLVVGEMIDISINIQFAKG